MPEGQGIQIVILLSAAVLCAGLGLVALFCARGSFVYRVFSAGMLLLAMEQLLRFVEIGSLYPAWIQQANFARMLAEGLDSCAWLIFSICFAREDWKGALSRWRWVIVAAAVLPFSAISISYGAQFTVFDSRWELSGHLGQPPLFHWVLTLAIAVMVLLNIQETLRSSNGAIRWQIKFMLVGIGFIFASRIYCAVERILLSGNESLLSSVESGALLIADFLIIVSILRSKLENITIHVSQDLLHNSIAGLIAVCYLAFLGTIAKIGTWLGLGHSLLRNAFIILIAVVGVLALFMSGGVRFGIRRFVTRHFKRPFHDYKKIWETLTKRTVSLVDSQDMCTAVSGILAETFGVASVSIWLRDEQKRPVLSGSTHLSRRLQIDPKTESEIRFLMLSMQHEQGPVKLGWPRHASRELPRFEMEAHPEEVNGVHCCTPLAAGGSFLGIVTLGCKLTGEEFTLEDLDLLQTIADQTASFILNRKLFEDLGEAREMEAFENLSTFFIHDLKNLASTLALTFQSLPVHFDNPEYREDAVKVIGTSVQKIQSICSRLSAFHRRNDLNLMHADLNEVVLSAVSDFENCAGLAIRHSLGGIPPLKIDPDKIRSVLSNLILNAREASGEQCLIRVATSMEKEYAVISVRDNGCGISRQFMDKNLFKPFKSTKSKGLGIGLYHGRLVVQAHRGRIEVESEPGRGSEFRVLLPVRA